MKKFLLLLLSIYLGSTSLAFAQEQVQIQQESTSINDGNRSQPSIPRVLLWRNEHEIEIITMGMSGATVILVDDTNQVVDSTVVSKEFENHNSLLVPWDGNYVIFIYYNTSVWRGEFSL